MWWPNGYYKIALADDTLTLQEVPTESNGGPVLPFPDGRLIEDLRAPLIAEVAKGPAGQPINLIVKSVLASIGGDAARANAFADLAVSGRQMFANFCATPPSDAQVLALVPQQPPGINVAAVVSACLDRAYGVAWALRGLLDRTQYGWVAVSSEDDLPHRPVNVPSGLAFSASVGPYEQYNVDISVQPTANAVAATVNTRFAVAYPNPPPPRAAPSYATWGRSAPPIPTTLNADLLKATEAPRGILLFLHGNASRLEECANLLPYLVAQGFAVIAMDLPCYGYASRLESTCLAPIAPNDSLTAFPVLEFVEQFVVDFVATVRVFPSIPLRIIATMGGSLGGSLSLRLGTRRGSDTGGDVAFLTNVIAWSPASVWNPITGIGPGQLRTRMEQDPPPAGEETVTRPNFFFDVFDQSVPFVGNIAQTWWRGTADWKACQLSCVWGAIADDKETYGQLLRRWDWRLSYEQLLFSHLYQNRCLNDLTHTLLIAGDQDNFDFAGIYDATQAVSAKMVNTPGVRLLFTDTGHSIHNERPQALASAIAEFLPSILAGAWPWRAAVDLGAPPGVEFSPDSEVAVATNEDGRLEIFARCVDNRFWHIWQLTSGGWSAWTQLDQGLDAADIVGESLSVVPNNDGHLELFAFLANEGWVMHVWQDGPNGVWGSWDKGNSISQLVGGATDALCATERVGTDAFGNPVRLLLIATILATGNVNIRGQNTLGSWWANGMNLGSSQISFTGRPVVYRNRDGRLEIFARDSNGTVHHIWENQPDQWTDDWSPVAAQPNPIVSDLGVGLSSTGCLFACGVGADGNLYVNQQQGAGGGWGNWIPYPVVTAAGNSVPLKPVTPSVVLNRLGQLLVFSVDVGGVVFTRNLESITASWEEIFPIQANFPDGVGSGAVGSAVKSVAMPNNSLLLVIPVNAQHLWVMAEL